MKICKTCKQEKNEKEFNKNKYSKDGLDYLCKECKKIKKKSDYLKYKDKYLERARKRRKKRVLNPKLREQDHIKHIEWCNRNPDKIKGYRNNQGHSLGLTTKQYQKMVRDERLVQSLFFYSDGTMKCSICQEDDIDVLELDHINGNGINHRKENNIKSMSKWCVLNNFPDGFRVLCSNCNKREKYKLYGGTTYY